MGLRPQVAAEGERFRCPVCGHVGLTWLRDELRERPDALIEHWQCNGCGSFFLEVVVVDGVRVADDVSLVFHTATFVQDDPLDAVGRGTLLQIARGEFA